MGKNNDINLPLTEPERQQTPRETGQADGQTNKGCTTPQVQTTPTILYEVHVIPSSDSRKYDNNTFFLSSSLLVPFSPSLIIPNATPNLPLSVLYPSVSHHYSLSLSLSLCFPFSHLEAHRQALPHHKTLRIP